MEDFEVITTDTAKELELLRKLFKVMDQHAEQYTPRIFPFAVRTHYEAVKEHLNHGN